MVSENRSTADMSWGRVSFLEWSPGTAAAATVLLLHGGGVDNASLSWGGIGPQLAGAGYRVIAPDHPGYGESARPPWPVTQQRLVEYVGEFADVVDLRRYVVGGLSLGGGMAIGHVIARPERVSAAMLLGSYGLMGRLSEGPLAGVRQFVTWTMVRTGLLEATTRWIGGRRAAIRWTMSSLIRDPGHRTPELMDEVFTAAAQGRGLEAFGQWQRDQVRWNRLATDYTRELRTFPRPVLIVHGDRDTAVPLSCAEAAAHAMPDAQLRIIPGAGHWVQRDHPDEVVAAIAAFLTGLTSA
ncbi:alpha/beta hydrolase fold protein [Mycolicibacterium aurum]|uniref:Alpha/beta hydrolase fold protein n=1 Tax=Mycolicibacterium aurum TaxID=1791 RepID=A0A448IME4_MYCAU|nr:alpha/beta hydrolase fold protein [Mycolicibacterium aurum]